MAHVSLRISLGVAAGAAIAAVDTVALAGEVSPIVIVALLLAATSGAGAFWGRRGWPFGIASWACIPLAHLARHVMGWPDTLQLNTYASIGMLAAFSLAVVAIGTACGIAVHGFRTAAGGGPVSA